MRKIHIPMLLAAALATAIPAVAQIAQLPGAPDPTRIVAGTYKVDTNHTQVVWTVNHLGLSLLTGALGASGGTLDIDPAKLEATKVSVTFNVVDMSTTAPAFTKHLLNTDLLDAAKFPTATFTSTAVKVNGDSAKITGNLTLKGITKPVTLDAKFFGAGLARSTKKLNVGFSATATIDRSEFGLGFGGPAVSNEVDLRIAGAFELPS